MKAAASRWREWGLAAVALAPFALVFLRARLPQDVRYHGLVDTRTWLGMPNAADVVSNVPFLAVGLAGLLLCARRRVAGANLAWTVFFLGVALVSFGSSWYHLQPDNGTLVWDRLPITVAFMGLFTALVAEHAGLHFERALLAPAVAAGVATVAWWVWTDDLRPYVWVQAAPLLCIGYVLTVYRGRYTHRWFLAAGLACYALAKATEFGDAEIFELTGRMVSGHTVKHLLAALAVFLVYLMLRLRSPVPRGGGPDAAAR